MEFVSLAKSYNPLMYRNKLADTLNTFFNTSRYNDFEKHLLHQEFNKIIIENYQGEEYFKYLLAKEFFKKNVIAAFEVKVNNSRLDFLTINGDTKSFEIKSGRDNLTRLNKQTNSYRKVFEYNYVVTDISHVNKVMSTIDDSYGVWVYNGKKKNEVRAATLNLEIDPKMQLSLLTKKERLLYFAEYSIDVISTQFEVIQINKYFKEALKDRYNKRWTFVTKNQQNILPLDVQFFFNTNIQPSIIYT